MPELRYRRILTDFEVQAIQNYANSEGISFQEACDRLAKEINKEFNKQFENVLLKGIQK